MAKWRERSWRHFSTLPHYTACEAFLFCMSRETGSVVHGGATDKPNERAQLSLLTFVWSSFMSEEMREPVDL